MQIDGIRSLFFFGVVFHVIYVVSIFDIYFTSPVVPDVSSFKYTDDHSDTQPPAKRAVIFVADGCRADKIFESKQSGVGARSRAPYLRKLIETKASWGVSHTRVPTESRPGHVALFAGMYEDVSAVTKGWRDNPVKFDSIFNQSRQSWLFGSPDIVPMFTRDVPHAHDFTYASELENFASNNASLLDVWVYDRLKTLLRSAEHDKELYHRLHSPQVIFFFHYLGIDTNGHAHRPDSRDYLENIELVDRLVQKTERLLSDFYGNDAQTAYIFTADHGMSNKGAHGDGDPANTRTPLLAWGAGVASPEKILNSDESFTFDNPTESSSQIDYQIAAQSVEELAARKWDLGKYLRKDVMQADIAALISSLIGLPYPRNSVGVLPYTYLKHSRYRARAVVSNLEQMHLHVLKKEQEKEMHSLFHFQSYKEFKDTFPRELYKARALLRNNEFESAEQHCQQLIRVCLDTLTYLHRYDSVFLLTTIVGGYLGYMVILLFVYTFAREKSLSLYFGINAMLLSVSRKPSSIDKVLLLILSTSVIYLALEHSPIMYHLYLGLLIIIWRYVQKLSVLISWNRKDFSTNCKQLGPFLFACMMAVELFAIGYHYRSVFGLIFTVLAIMPPFKHATGKSGKMRLLNWRLSCFVTSVFPYLPAEYGDSLALVLLGSTVFCIFMQTACRRIERCENSQQIAFTITAMCALSYTMSYLQAKKSPPMALTIFNWLLAWLPILHLFYKATQRKGLAAKCEHPNIPTLFCQYQDVLYAFAPAYILLSISYEVLFYVSFCYVLISWVEMEKAEAIAAEDKLNVQKLTEFRRAILFLLFIKMAFFGTGNVASMSSFEISSTYRFVTSFAPFLMGSLLIFKILIPFVAVSCAFFVVLGNDVHARMESNVSAWNYFTFIIFLSDILALHFLFLIRDEGSWKEIGNSISHFGIVNAQIVFLPLLFFIATQLLIVKKLSSEDILLRDSLREKFN